MRFWDSSSIVPLIVEENETPKAKEIFRDNPGMFVAWITESEIYSALCRLEREAGLDVKSFDKCIGRLKRLSSKWQVVIPSSDLLEEIKRVLRLHPLRAADAHQLASGILCSEREPRTLEFITFDSRLKLAARREGFTLSPGTLG